MITSVTVRRFKSFGDETIELDEAVVLAGPNNSGKTTLLQAIATWHAALQQWLTRRTPGETTAKARSGVQMLRQQFTAIPVREMALLWQGRQTSGVEAPPGRKRRIEIILSGNDGGGWECGVEIEYGTPETVNVRPIGSLEGADISNWPPQEAMDVRVVHIPPMSGISREEPRHDRGYQDLLIGQGRPGEVLRNLLYEVSQQPQDWTGLCEHISTLFGFELLEPTYAESDPHIICEYRPENKARPLDIANAGSGFLQVLLLFAFFYARPGSVLLLDEPDAHLHVILQKEMHDVLRRIAADRRSQLLIATHSEVLLDATSPERVISFVKTRPRRLADRSERDALREAMKRLTTTELLMAEQTGAIIYLEDQSDERILSAWAGVLDHPARAFLDQPFVHQLGGNSVKAARDHFFAFRSVIEPVAGLVILDGDDRDIANDEDVGNGLRVVRWQRYEIENYLLIPRAIAAVGGWGEDTLIIDAVNKVFHREVPPGTDLFADVAGLSKIKASERFLPELLHAAGRDLAKRDFFLVAAQMRPEEIHSDVVDKLDLIAKTLNRPDADLIDASLCASSSS
jgi:predicted ATPase